MSRSALLIACFLAAALSLAACDDGEGTPAPTETAPVDLTTVPSATATPLAERTGIPEVDAVLNTLFSGDEEAIPALIGFTAVECEVEPIGLGAPPQCREDEPDGTAVDVFPMAQCEGFYVRPEDFDATTLVTPGPVLVAIYDAEGKVWPPGEYVAVYTGVGDSRRADVAYAVSIEEGRIAGIHLGCGMTPERYADFFDLEERLYPPSAGSTSAPRQY